MDDRTSIERLLYPRKDILVLCHNEKEGTHGTKDPRLSNHGYMEACKVTRGLEKVLKEQRENGTEDKVPERTVLMSGVGARYKDMCTALGKQPDFVSILLGTPDSLEQRRVGKEGIYPVPEGLESSHRMIGGVVYELKVTLANGDTVWYQQYLGMRHITPAVRHFVLGDDLPHGAWLVTGRPFFKCLGFEAKTGGVYLISVQGEAISVKEFLPPPEPMCAKQLLAYSNFS